MSDVLLKRVIAQESEAPNSLLQHDMVTMPILLDISNVNHQQNLSNLSFGELLNKLVGLSHQLGIIIPNHNLD